MKVLLSWLKEYVDFNLAPDELAEALMLSGTAIESLTEIAIDGSKDWVLELEITPNRPDCMSMIGIAREVAALTGGKLKVPEIKYIESARKAESEAKISIKDLELCPRYIGMVIEDVKIDRSPQWMKNRLKAAGIRPINNVVDVTNYVLIETGQPLHAFDWSKLKNGTIIVRRAKNKEKIMTLDGVKRELNDSTLVIADEEKPVALAGVMGSDNSEVDDSTTKILLESAYFNPQNIMVTSRSLGLISESSIRFERGIDPANTEFAAKRAAQLFQQLCGGKILKGKIDVYPKPMKPWKIKLRTDRVNDILGTKLSQQKINSRLSALRINVEKTKDGEFNTTIPTFRQDLEREIDLIEEVARLEGYGSIPSALPKNDGGNGGLTTSQKLQHEVEATLTGFGLWEGITYSLINEQLFDKLNLPKNDFRRNAVRLKNPISDEMAVLRTTLLPGLISSAAHNVSRNIYNVQIYEKGRISHQGQSLHKDCPLARTVLDEQPEEILSLGILLTGSWDEKEWWNKTEEKVNLYDLKGLAEQLLRVLNILNYKFSASKDVIFQSGNGIDLFVNNTKIGSFGQLNPAIQENFDLPNEVFFGEFNLPLLISFADEKSKFKEIPKYPSIDRDVALLVDESVVSEDIADQISKTGGNLLKNVRLFDKYTGKGIPEEKKSLAYSLNFYSEDRTLKDEEVDETMSRIISTLEKSGYKIR